MRRKQNFENKNKRVFQKAKVAKRMVAIPSSEELTKTFMHKISQTLLPHFSHVFLGHSGVFRWPISILLIIYGLLRKSF